MNIVSVTTVPQPLCEDLWQDSMRQTSQTAQDVDREVSVVTVAPPESGGNRVDTVLERVRAQQKNRALKTVSSGNGGANGNASAVATSLENVGPNTYERIRQNAGRTYLAQAMSFAEENTAAMAVLYKSA